MPKTANPKRTPAKHKLNPQISALVDRASEVTGLSGGRILDACVYAQIGEVVERIIVQKKVFADPDLLKEFVSIIDSVEEPKEGSPLRRLIDADIYGSKKKGGR